MVLLFHVTLLHRGRAVRHRFNGDQTVEHLFVFAAHVFGMHPPSTRLMVPGLGCWKFPGDAPAQGLLALRDKRVLVTGCRVEEVVEINKAVSRRLLAGEVVVSEAERVAEAREAVDERARVALTLIGTAVDADMDEALEEGEVPSNGRRPRRYFGRKAPLHWYVYGQPRAWPQAVLSRGFLEQVIGTQLIPRAECPHGEHVLPGYGACAPCMMRILFQWGYFLFRHYELVLAVLEDECRFVDECGFEPAENFPAAIEDVTNRLRGLVEELNSNRALETGGTFYLSMRQLREDLDFDFVQDVVANDPEDGCIEDVVSLCQSVAFLDWIEYVDLDSVGEDFDSAPGSFFDSDGEDGGTGPHTECAEEDWADLNVAFEFSQDKTSGNTD